MYWVLGGGYRRGGRGGRSGGERAWGLRALGAVVELDGAVDPGVACEGCFLFGAARRWEGCFVADDAVGWFHGDEL